MLHKGTNGYWRDTLTINGRKTTKTFGHFVKVSKTKAMVQWREWKKNAKESPDRRYVKTDSPALTNVIEEYLAHAGKYYRHPDKTPTGEADSIFFGLQPLDDLYGDMPADQFQPHHMQGFIEAQTITTKNGKATSRQTINKRLGYIRRMFKWLKNNAVCADVYDRIRDFPDVTAGRTDARESKKILPVPTAVVDATAIFLSPVVKDMVEVQRLGGMRPEDICHLNAKDIRVDGKLGLYTPTKHKNAWRGKSRRIWLGPQAMKILAPYLKAKLTGPIFSNAKGGPFTTRTYRQAIWRACDRAFPSNDPKVDGETIRAFRKRTAAWRVSQRWSPNQLRHSRLTEIENAHGMEAARTVAGHSSASTTAIYVERDDAATKALMLKIG